MQNINTEYIKIVINCYEIYGIKTAIEYLYTTSKNFEKDLTVILNEIYKINELEYQATEEIKYILKSISDTTKDSQNIVYLNRGYKGEWRTQDFVKLKINSDFIKSSLKTLSNLLERDIEKKTSRTK